MATAAAQAILSTGEDNAWQISGALNFHSVPDLMPRIEAQMSQASGHLQVNLGEISHSDSAGMALLLEWVRQAEDRGIRIEFTSVPEQLANLARVTGLAGILGINN